MYYNTIVHATKLTIPILRGGTERSITAMGQILTGLENRLRVVVTPMPAAQSASLCIFAAAGSRYEEQRVNGISHYVEHMLFKGTKKRPRAPLLAEAIEGAGGRMNAFTSKELTCYVAKVPWEKIELALDVLSDMIQAPLLAPEEVDRERSVILEEIKREHDSPGAWVGELLSQATYGDQPLGWNIAGSEESVNRIQHEDLTSYLNARYGSNNLIVSIAGRVDPEEMVALTRRYLLEREPREASAFWPFTAKGEGRSVLVETRPIAQAHLALGVQAFSYQDPERYVVTVLTTLLGGGMSSRLFQEVRERRGLAYSVGCGVSRHHDTGLLTAHAGVAAGNVVETCRIILQEFAKLTQEPVGAEELTKTKDYTIGSFRLGLEDTMSVARRAGENLLTLGQIEEVDAVIEHFRAVSADDLLRVARRLFSGGPKGVAVVGPQDDGEQLRELLAP